MLKLKINLNQPQLLCIVISASENGKFEQFGGFLLVWTPCVCTLIICTPKCIINAQPFSLDSGYDLVWFLLIFKLCRICRNLMNKNQLSAEIFCFIVLLSAASVKLKVKIFKTTKQISDYLQSREIKFFAMQCFHLRAMYSTKQLPYIFTFFWQAKNCSFCYPIVERKFSRSYGLKKNQGHGLQRILCRKVSFENCQWLHTIIKMRLNVAFYSRHNTMFQS